jgi:hypothetical protein
LRSSRRHFPGRRVFTFAPDDTPRERLYRFKEGGLLPPTGESGIHLPDGSRLSPKPSALKMQAQWLMDQLDAGVCICDDFNPRWSDVQTHSDFERMPHQFGVGEEVYHLLRREDGVDALENALRCSDTIWHGVTAVCAYAPQIAADRTASLEELRAAAASATLITCTAYDGEGFVAWRRT